MKKILLLSTALVIPFSSAQAEDSIKHKGSIEGGITIENGNTETENYRGSLSLTSTYDIYENVFRADASNTKQGDVRTGEEYNISNQMKAALSEVLYGFGQVDFTEDRYQGFNYRTSELVGLGYKIIDQENLEIDGEIAAGARQTDYTRSQDDEESAIGRVTGIVDWKINEHVSFDNRSEFTMGEDNNITNINTGLKAFLDQNLYIRFAHELEHNSDTKGQAKNTDTRTFITIGYEFK